MAAWQRVEAPAHGLALEVPADWQREDGVAAAALVALSGTCGSLEYADMQPLNQHMAASLRLQEAQW